MLVGMVEVQSGLQLSCGEWPHRLAPGIVAAAQSHAGDRERRLHMNVGEGLDVSVDVDVNEPAWLREEETGQEEKKGEKVVNSEKRQKEDHQALRKNRDENTQRESMMESVRQETQTHAQTNRLNNTDQKPPPHKDSSSSTWTHREMGPLNDGKSQQTHTERALDSSIVVPELCDKHPLHSVSQHPVSLALNIASNFESARGPSPQVHNNLMHVFICKYVFVSSTMY